MLSQGRRHTRRDEYQGHGRRRRGGQRRQMGFERLRDLIDEDNLENITLELASDKSGFESMLHSHSMTFDEIRLVLAVVDKTCSTDHKEGLKKVLKTLCTSGFLDTHLVNFFERLHHYDEIADYTNHVFVICEEILKKSPRYAGKCVDALQRIGCAFSDCDIIHDNPELEAHRAELERTCIQHVVFGQGRSDEEEPPDNYRNLEMFPSSQDLLSDEQPFLRQNKDKGAYSNLDTYLDVQFRLLREDYIQPLRKGILEYKQSRFDKAPNKVADTWLYHDVQIMRSVCSDDIDTRLTFDVSRVGRIRWQSSKRLIYGSLVCLSRDNFETMLFATVTNRTVRDLLKGNIQVRFEQDFDIVLNISPTDTFVMAETPAYFEAYRHVLSRLQQIEDSLPFQRYLVHCETNIQQPGYLNRDVRYDMSALGKYTDNLTSVPVLNTSKWPPQRSYDLNEVQLQAAKTALAKELAIIQGPPGTGKTYVGLKIMQVLLKNKDHLGSNSGILVVCYTNHALDQFLEGIHKFHPHGIIRVGGRSSSTILEPYNLKELRMDRRRKKRMRQIVHDNFLECKDKMAAIKNTVEEVGCRIEASMLGVLHEDTLRPHMESHHWRSLLNRFRVGKQSAILSWLEFKHLPVSTGVQTTFQRLIDEWTRAILDFVRCKESAMEDPSYAGDILSMPFVDRAHVYKIWLVKFRQNVTREKGKIEKECQAETVIKGKGKDFILRKLTAQLRQAAMAILPDACLQQFVPRRAYDLIKDTYSEYHDEYSIKMWLGATPHVDVAEVDLYDAIQELNEISSGLSNADEAAAIITGHRYIDDEVDIFTNRSSRQSAQMSKAINNLALSFQSLLSTTVHEGKQSANEQVQAQHKRNQKKRLERILMEAQPINTQILHCRDVWDLDMTDRESLYKTWVTAYQHHWKVSIKDKEQEYRQLSQRRKEVLREEDKDILSQADIIGMTTTGAAKHASLLEAVAPRIVIVEEAAEVLESHIITTLNPECQQLILIGDHQQLRPNPTVYELARKYNLDISLFERLVKNGLHHVTLELQHRMRPEISVLMKHIYPKLKDHISVTECNSIRGVDKNVFFLSHQHREHHLNETMSKSNEHEASFIVALCRYFLLQGYEASDITILAAYTGQISLIKRHMGKEIDLFQDVRLTSVDNFQGEECKIVLLSFVRSNEEGSVGFLSIDNRICVALSRAREGMFAVGNFHLFAEKSPLWASIVGTLQSTNSIGPHMLLRCTNHPEMTISVSSARDFEKAPSGGCTKSCGVRLKCGHTCDKLCHVNDIEHTEHPCTKLCMVRLSCGHRCAGICVECAENSLHAGIKVTKWIQFGHNESRPCILPKCVGRCARPLPCGHPCKGICGDCTRNGCMEKCDEIVNVTLTCGHVYQMQCLVSKKSYKCSRKCEQQLACGHKCMQTCSQCRMVGHVKKCVVATKHTFPCGHAIKTECHSSGLQKRCLQPCTKLRPCGHPCKGICGDCTRNGCMEKCDEIVNVTLKCGHVYPMQCLVSKKSYKCSRKCEQQLACGHKCMQTCSQCRMVGHVKKCVVATKHTLPCGHAIETECHSSALQKRCLQPCTKLRPCGHPCRGICGDCIQNGCMEKCDEIVNVTLKCGHVYQMQCLVSKKSYKCSRKCEQQLACGHKCMQTCSQCRMVGHVKKCVVATKHTLPCGHAIETECHSSALQNRCLQPCTKLRPCGHPCKGICGDCTRNGCMEKCDEIVNVTLKCGHVYQMQCQVSKKSYKCSRKCEQQLACGHKCMQTCSQCRMVGHVKKCVVATKHTFPCGHAIETECHSSALQKRCLQPCTKVRPCGHPCKGICGDCTRNGCMEKCDEIVYVTLKCGHVYPMQCLVSKKSYKCSRKCKQQLACGHKCMQTCSQCRMVGHVKKCVVATKHTFPCGHAIETECHSSALQKRCLQPCTKLRPCGHPCKGTCGDCTRNGCMEKCDEIVYVTLKCGHVYQMQCLVSKKSYKCSRKCEQQLACGHKCMQTCSQCRMVGHVKKCVVATKHTFPCGHAIETECHSSALQKRCLQPCTKLRPCGHPCKGICGDCTRNGCMEKCDEIVYVTLKCGHVYQMQCLVSKKSYKCSRKCEQQLACGHKCMQTCSQCRMVGHVKKCVVATKHTFPCGHAIETECHSSALQKRCLQPCTKLRPCDHPCKGICGDCTRNGCMEKCDEVVNVTLKCGHVYPMQCLVSKKSYTCFGKCEQQLACGHKCMQTCSLCSIFGHVQKCRHKCEQ